MILYLSFPPAITENNVCKSEREKNTILWPGFPSSVALVRLGPSRSSKTGLF